ncbi:MAG: LppP/LprE family lipoprotein [Mycobacterium sp.]
MLRIGPTVGAGLLALAATVMPVTTTAHATPGTCGVNLKAPQIAASVATLPPYPGTGWQWSTGYVAGNFDPCATLSTAIVSVQGATASSPDTALMFHKGEYLGTATSEAYGFTFFNSARTTDDTVVLDYKTPGVCDACAPAAVNSVRYQWQGDHVVMLDPAPPSN